MPATWIEASRSPVVPGTGIHAIALTPLLLYVVWWSWWTFFLMVIVSAVMGYMQIKGRQPAWVVRRLKSRLRGHQVQARPLWYRRRRTRIETFDTIDVHEAYSIGGGAPGKVAKSAPAEEERKGARNASRDKRSANRTGLVADDPAPNQSHEHQKKSVADQ